MEKLLSDDPWIVGGKLCSEVNPFLLIGLTARDLVSNRKVAAPGSAAEFHANRQFCVEILCEELAAEILEPSLDRIVDPMPDNIEKT